MLAKSLLLPALASVAAAETVTSMLIYFADNQPLDASIVGNDATATTYSINCPPGTDGSDCGMGPGLTAIISDDTTTFAMDDGDDFHMTIKCTNTGSSALCTESAGGPEANFPGKSTSTIARSEGLPVTITAGRVSSVDATPTASGAAETSSEGDAEETGSASSGSKTTSAPTPSETSDSASASETGDADEPSETGAAVKVSGLAGMMVGGAVVALMGAVL